MSLSGFWGPEKLMKKFFALAFFALLLASPAVLAAGLSELDFSEKKPMVVVVSPDWHDALLAANLAQRNGAALRFVQDLPQLQSLVEELEAPDSGSDTAIVLAKAGNELPSLSYRLRSTNLNVLDFSFHDYKDLMRQLSEREAGLQKAKRVVLVRDDFAFDALSSKLLSIAADAQLLFARGTGELHPETIAAIEKISPAEIFAVGAFDERVLSRLSKFEVRQVGGRDEFETSRRASALATTIAGGKGVFVPRQALITPGDVLEKSLLNSGWQQIFLVPFNGTYSLFQLSQVVNETGLDLLVGIGHGVADSGAYVRQRTGVRVMVRLGSVKTAGVEGQIVKRDIATALDGYVLPLPNYNGTISIASSTYSDTVSAGTGLLFAPQKKPAPPVTLHASYRNTGNIESPVSVSFRVFGEASETLATLQTAEQFVKPGEAVGFSAQWDGAPQEGKYSAEATAVINVYDGLAIGTQKMGFDLAWMMVWASLALLLLAVALLSFAAYYSHKASRKMKQMGALSDSVGNELDKMSRTLSKPAKEEKKNRGFDV